MQHWITATLIGVGLGLALYICVRLRMHLGPVLRRRYGNWARLTYWGVTFVVMIALANAALIGLRWYMAGQGAVEDSLMLEIWFTLLAVAIAMYLIFNRLRRQQ